jgi:hypothetical protein
MFEYYVIQFQNQNPAIWFQSPQHISATTARQEDPVEDLIYLLSAILEQAKELTLGETGTTPMGTFFAHSLNSRRRTTARHGSRGNLGNKITSNNKLRDKFDLSVTLLIDYVRRDIDTSSADLSDDSVLVRHVLKWLYRGMDEDRRHLAPVLRPYLNSLFAASHENGWHLEEWRRRLSDHEEEMRVLGSYCNLVVGSEVSATGALLDAFSKGWVWAEKMLDTAEYLVRSDVTGQPDVGLHLVLTPAEGEVIRRSVAVPSSRDELQLPESRYSTFSSTKSTHSRCTGTINVKKALSLRPTSVTLPIMLAQRPGNSISKGKHSNWSYTACNGAEWTELAQDRKQNTKLF